MGGRHPVVVVGGGTAGSVLVAHLASVTRRDIVVIEPGAISAFDDESRFLDLPKSSDLLESMSVRQVAGGEPSIYAQARAMGGGSAVNGLLLTGDEPDYVRGLTRMADTADMGRMSRALRACGGRPSRLWWNGGRWNPGRALAHLVDEGRVQWVNLPALGIDSKSGASTVSFSSGAIETDCLVLTAGALRTPELLLRSGLGEVNDAIGDGLQNHPTITMALEFDDVDDAPFDATVVREFTSASGGMGLLIAFERASWTEPDLGLLSGALMNPTSQGRVSLAGAHVDVDFNMLDSEWDVRAMCEVVRELASTVASDGFTRICRAIHADSTGTSVDDVRSMSDSDLVAWIRGSLQPVSHASGSCRHAVGQNGELKGVPGVWLADASILPGVPSCTPAAPVTMGALRVARALGKELE